MALQSGSLLNSRYVVQNVIATKGSITIYRAFDQVTGTEVGIKQMEASSTRARQNVIKESKLFSSLRHPNLMHITDAFEHLNQGTFQVTDFVNSKKVFSPSQYPGGMSVRQAAPIILAVCDVLYYLHHNQPPVIHGEINPDTIALSQDDQVVLILPGWLLIHGQNSTVDFPESDKRAKDSRQDIYDLALTLLNLLSNQSKNVRESQITPILLKEILNRSESLLPDTIVRVITKALDPDQALRFQSIEEFKSALLNAVIFMPPESISDPHQPKPVTESQNQTVLPETKSTGITPESEPIAASPIRRRVPWGLVSIYLSIGSVVLGCISPKT